MLSTMSNKGSSTYQEYKQQQQQQKHHHQQQKKPGQRLFEDLEIDFTELPPVQDRHTCWPLYVLSPPGYSIRTEKAKKVSKVLLTKIIPGTECLHQLGQTMGLPLWLRSHKDYKDPVTEMEFAFGLPASELRES